MTTPATYRADKASLNADSLPASDRLEAGSAAATLAGEGESALWQQAVLLWMQWHEAQERLTAAMFRSRHDTVQQAELLQEMDHLDQLRWRAVELSQEMLSHAQEFSGDAAF